MLIDGQGKCLRLLAHSESELYKIKPIFSQGYLFHEHCLRLFCQLYQSCIIPLTTQEGILFLFVGETAVSLGQNVEFIDRVADLCDCEIHAGVSGEANRSVSVFQVLIKYLFHLRLSFQLIFLSFI